MFIDLSNRGQSEHTVTRLTPGVEYYFLVASNNSRYGTPKWLSAPITLTTARRFIGPRTTRRGGLAGPIQPAPACPVPGSRPTANVRGDYDADDDGLIEVANLAQLDAIRYDLAEKGAPFQPADLLRCLPQRRGRHGLS